MTTEQRDTSVGEEGQDISPFIQQAKDLALLMVRKLDPAVGNIFEIEMPIQRGYSYREYTLVARQKLENGNQLAIAMSRVEGMHSASSLCVGEFSMEDVPAYAKDFDPALQAQTALMVFPAARSRMFFFRPDGDEMRHGWNNVFNDAGLLKQVEDLLNTDWEVLSKGFHSTDPLRAE